MGLKLGILALLAFSVFSLIGAASLGWQLRTSTVVSLKATGSGAGVQGLALEPVLLDSDSDSRKDVFGEARLLYRTPDGRAQRWLKRRLLFVLIGLIVSALMSLCLGLGLRQRSASIGSGSKKLLDQLSRLELAFLAMLWLSSMFLIGTSTFYWQLKTSTIIRLTAPSSGEDRRGRAHGLVAGESDTGSSKDIFGEDKLLYRAPDGSVRRGLMRLTFSLMLALVSSLSAVIVLGLRLGKRSASRVSGPKKLPDKP